MPTTLSEEEQLRDRIKSLASQLPEAILLKSGRRGEHVDLGEAFEVNIGTKSTLDDAQKRRVERCINVLQSLTKDNAKLGSTYWVQVFDVINDELDVAHSCLAQAKELPASDWKQFEDTPVRRIKGRFDELSKIRKYRESIPDWLDELGFQELEDHWDQVLPELNRQARQFLRANTLKNQSEELAALLAAAGIEVDILSSESLVLKKRKNTKENY